MINKHVDGRDNKHARVIALIIAVIMALSCIVMPFPSEAAGKKSKYTITINNLDSNTVLQRGGTYRINYSVIINKGRRTSVRFKSSNRRIATVSKKGVIRAKRNGIVKITVYAKKNKRCRRTMTIRVGDRIGSVWLSGYKYIRLGRKTSLHANISPASASNKALIWTSNNPSIISVDNAGNIIGLREGKATITAKAVDGSGVTGTMTVLVHRFLKSDANWVAHAGLNSMAKENTARAFELAGENGFWGCECDIWETKHQVVHKADIAEDALIENRGLAVDEKIEEEEDLFIIEEEGDGDHSEETNSEEKIENNDSAELEASEDIVETEEVNRQEEKPSVQGTVNAKVSEERFDIVVNHDASFRNQHGVDVNIKETTAEEIKADKRLKEVCFFDDYLKICGKHNMVPFIELKDPQISDEGIKRIVDMVNSYGLLDSAHFISFEKDNLVRVKGYASTQYGIEPDTAFLIQSNAMYGIEIAKNAGFTGIDIYRSLLNNQVMNKCREYGMTIDTWTYSDSAYDDELLYRHFIRREFSVQSATINGKLFE